MPNQPEDNRNDLPPQLPVRACPWCQQLPLLLDGLHHGYFICCMAAGCAVTPETRSYDTAEQAAAAWNGATS